MTNEYLQELIENYDNYKNENLIIDIPISENITYAINFLETQKSLDYYIFYFIKKDNKCIATVEDLGGDIHAFVLEECRRKNIMFDALKETILPHMKFKRLERSSIEKLYASAFTRSSYLLMIKLGFIMESTTLIDSADDDPDGIVPIKGYILLKDIQDKSWDMNNIPLLNDFDSVRKFIKNTMYEAKNKLQLIEGLFKFFDLDNESFHKYIYKAWDSAIEARIEAEMLFEKRYLKGILNE
jgi:hypothetical protein